MWMLECEFEDLALVSVKNETKSSWHSMLLVIFFFSLIANYNIQKYRAPFLIAFPLSLMPVLTASLTTCNHYLYHRR